MPFADQVPVSSSHSILAQVGCPDRWIDWSALRAVCPSQPSHHAGWPARSCSGRKRDRFLVAFTSGHHGPHHAREFVGKRDGGNLGGPARQ
jgi:hypothetical protein